MKLKLTQKIDMPKFGNAKIGKIHRPFYKDNNLQVTTIEKDNKIIRFVVLYKEVETNVDVIKNNILKAWMKVEELKFK